MMLKHYLRITIVVLGVMMGCNHANAQKDNYELLPDSSNFVISSLVIATPGEQAYSSLGHCGIRMECPSAGLDFCFSFEMQSSHPWFNYIQYFAGNTPAGFLAIPTSQYIETYKSEGRGIKQYELNLSLHQEQELWRYLDNYYIEGANHSFDFIRNNCASMCLMAIESNTCDESIEIRKWPEQHKMNNGDGVCYLTRRSPWLQFALMTLIGNEADSYWIDEERTSPELIIEALKSAVIISVDSSERPLLTGNEQELLKKTKELSNTIITPIITFICLLIIVIVLILLEWKKRCTKIIRIIDIVLLVFQTLTGIILVYLTYGKGLFGSHWNYCLLLFNPLPFLVWLFFCKQKWYFKSYAIYAIVLLIFICLTPLITNQVMASHYIIAITFAIRCISKFIMSRKAQFST